jgi:hypothetical protein
MTEGWDVPLQADMMIRSPGSQLTLVNLEGNPLEELGAAVASLEIDTMQIKSILLT